MSRAATGHGRHRCCTGETGGFLTNTEYEDMLASAIGGKWPAAKLS